MCTSDDPHLKKSPPGARSLAIGEPYVLLGHGFRARALCTYAHCIEKEIEQPNLAKTPRAVAPQRRCQPSHSGNQWKGGRELLFLSE